MSYELSRETQVTIIRALVEGCSIRSVERMTEVHRDTIMRLMVRIGDRLGHYRRVGGCRFESGSL